MKIIVAIIGVPSLYRNRDWKRSKPNIDKYLLTGWGNNVKIQTIAVVGPLNNEKEFINSYRPIQFSLSGGLIQEKYEIAAKMMLDIDADLFIITRPDINFLTHVSTWNIDFNKFNFLHKEYPGFTFINEKYSYSNEFQIHSDNFFAFSGKYKQQFYDATMLLGSPEGLDFIKTSYDSIQRGECPATPGPQNHGYHPFIKKYIGQDNIHCIDDRLLISCTYGNEKYYMLDRDDNTHDIDISCYHIQYFFHRIPQAKDIPYAKKLFAEHPHFHPDNNNSIEPCSCYYCKESQILK